jgi:hypothetical protein
VTASTAQEAEAVAPIAPPAAEAVVSDPGDANRKEAEALRSELEDIKKALEAAKVSATDSNDLKQRIEQLSGKVEKQREAALSRVLSGMGVADHLKKYAPTVDPDTEEGIAELQKWAEAHPELVARPQAEEVFSAEKLKEKFRSPHLVNVEMLKGIRK